MKYTLEFMEEITNIPSPAGYTYECLDRVAEEFEKFGFEVKRTPKNALMVTLKGKNDDAQKMVVAHVDTIGAIVNTIKDNGRLTMAQLGGFSWNSVEGENVHIFTDEGVKYTGTILPQKASIHVYSEEVRTTIRTDENMEIRIDEFTSSREETKALGINIGDFIAFEPRFIRCDNGFIKTRHIDDKSVVAVVLGLCKDIAENKLELENTTHFLISNYEEVGHGVSFVPEKTEEILALDIGPVDSEKNCCEKSVCIPAKDSRTPYDFRFRNKLANLCKENNIDYRVDVYNRYGSDASCSILQGVNANYACIGPGVDATHHYERTHESGIENTLRLLKAYLIK